MNFIELCKELRSQCSVAGIGPDRIVNQTGNYLRLINWIRQSNTEIQAKYFNWKFLWRRFSHTEEQAKRLFLDTEAVTIAAPGDLNIWNLSSFWLNGSRIGAVEYSRWSREESFCGVPFLVVMPDNSLELHNKPAGFPEITADYYAVPQILKDDKDIPYIPDTYHQLIVYRGMMMYANYDNAPEVKSAAIEGMQSLMPQLEASQLPGQQDSMTVNEYDFVISPQ